MTLTMGALYRRLPASQRYSLPPKKIARKLLQKSGMDSLTSSQRDMLTCISHFGYGALAGAAYDGWTSRPSHPFLKGSLFGLGLWIVSYLGWIPAFQILPSATKQPKERNSLMIAAHVVWGSTTAAVNHMLRVQTR